MNLDISKIVKTQSFHFGWGSLTRVLHSVRRSGLRGVCDITDPDQRGVVQPLRVNLHPHSCHAAVLWKWLHKTVRQTLKEVHCSEEQGRK